MSNTDLQKRQAEYDAKYWQHSPGKFEKIRHITLHMGKLLGKLSTHCEAVEHGREGNDQILRKEVISDLQIYAFQLANLYGDSAEKRYLERIAENEERTTKKRCHKTLQILTSA